MTILCKPHTLMEIQTVSAEKQQEVKDRMGKTHRNIKINNNSNKESMAFYKVTISVMLRGFIRRRRI